MRPQGESSKSFYDSSDKNNIEKFNLLYTRSRLSFSSSSISSRWSSWCSHLSGSLESFHETSLEQLSTTTDPNHSFQNELLPSVGLNNLEQRQYLYYSTNTNRSTTTGTCLDGLHTMRAPTSTLYRPTATTILQEQSSEPDSTGSGLVQAKVKLHLQHQAPQHTHYPPSSSNPSPDTESMIRGPGGQRTALKLVAAAGQVQLPLASPSTQHQAAQVHHQQLLPHPSPPQDCCPSASTATTSSAASALSQQQPTAVSSPLPAPPTSNVPQPEHAWPPPPPPPRQHQPAPVQLAYGASYALHLQQHPHPHQLVDECTSDQELSECSCSNSLECLTLSQHSGMANGPQLQAPPPPPQHQHPFQLHHRHQHHIAPSHGYQHQHQGGAALVLGHASLPAPPAPPPLVRHNTYSATSDTITDATLLPNRQEAAMVAAHHPALVAYNNQAKGEAALRQHPPPPHLTQNQDQPDLRTNSADLRHLNGGTKNNSKQPRQSVSFRRSATATNEPSVIQTKRTRELYDHSSQLHGQRLAGAASLHFRPQANGQASSGVGNGSGVVMSNLTDANASLQRPSSSASQRQYQQQQTGSDFGLNQPALAYPHFSPLPMASGGSLPLMRATTTNATGSTTTNQMPLLFDPSTCPPMAPITSHRTNSPWMRLSSIILTPIGMVIILFIVVSPLLHYLM